MMTTIEAIEYITLRAERHGLAYQDIMNKAPSSVSDCPIETALWMKNEDIDISHIKPQSTHPELADDPSNVFLENGDLNSARRDNEATDLDVFIAKTQNETTAAPYDNDPGNFLNDFTQFAFGF